MDMAIIKMVNGKMYMYVHSEQIQKDIHYTAFGLTDIKQVNKIRTITITIRK